MSESNGSGQHSGMKQFREGYLFPVPMFICPECTNVVGIQPVAEVEANGQPALHMQGACECRIYRVLVPPVPGQYVDKPKIQLPGGL